MTTGLRVVALGQPIAGDDGAGVAVLEELRRRGMPAAVDLVHARDCTELLSLLETTTAVLIVDAATGGTPGDVIELVPEQLPSGLRSVSTHGIGLPDIIALARQLDPTCISPSIRIMAIIVAGTVRQGAPLSREVEAAVRRATDLITDRVRRLLDLTEQAAADRWS